MKQVMYGNKFEGGYRKEGHPFRFNSKYDPEIKFWSNVKPGQWLYTRDNQKGRFLGVHKGTGKVLVSWKSTSEGFFEYNNRFTNEYHALKSINEQSYPRKILSMFTNRK